MYPFQQDPRQRAMNRMLNPQTGLSQQLPQMGAIGAAMPGGMPPTAGMTGPMAGRGAQRMAGGPRPTGMPPQARGPQMNPMTGMPMNPRTGAMPTGNMGRPPVPMRPAPGVGQAMGSITNAMNMGGRPQVPGGLNAALQNLQRQRRG